MSLRPGDRLGPYEILSPIGAGGMGEVYRARDPRLGRDVAIKILAGHSTSGAAWQRFEREARMASSLAHPHICAVYDVGESAGQPYLVMELLEGQTLSEFIGSQPVEPAMAIALAMQIADALDAAHAKGVIHRDIKPGNIMLTGRRHVKVLDFGLAKHAPVSGADETLTVESLTETGSVVGTPHYLAPEILQGGRAGVESDVWALGVVLYQMLSGHPPFRGKTMVEVCSAILHDPPPPLPASVPEPLRRLVGRTLAKAPGDRFPTASAVREALDRLALPAAPPAATRRRWLWGAAGAGVLAAAGTLWTYGRRSAPPARLLSTGAPVSAKQEANDRFELAMQFMRRQNQIPRAQEMLEQALAIDREFPEALRSHGFNYLIQILNGYTNDTSLLYRADEELRHAAMLDPGLVSLPSAFAALFMMQGRRELVPVARLDEVIRENPMNIDTRLWRAILHWLGGENTDAKRMLREMLERDPVFGAGRTFLGEVLRTEGDLQGAIREENTVLEFAPDNISAVCRLSLALLNAGDLDQTRELLEMKRSSFEKNYLWRSHWALLLAVEGRREEALAAMDEGDLRFLRAAFVVTLVAAEFFALVGDAEHAIEWLDRAVRNGDERIEWFQRDPWLASIRRDPRFQTIMESVESRRRQRRGK